ncbi:hypothetical protein MCHI_000112 [Candidatus Magnetoovum chiemensis]|nr:hypothetical protein MCHI_000112 [Candidatus Magnetoovum chiemensis]
MTHVFAALSQTITPLFISSLSCFIASFMSEVSYPRRSNKPLYFSVRSLRNSCCSFDSANLLLNSASFAFVPEMSKPVNL